MLKCHSDLFNRFYTSPAVSNSEFRFLTNSPPKYNYL